MRTAIVKVILLLGRHALLPLVALTAAGFMGWFVVLDHHPSRR
jgi:hypothetical protein